VGLLLNLLALVLVLVLSWGGTLAMARWAHRRRDDAPYLSAPSQECWECSGVGARRRLGQLEPCPVCEGRGVVTVPTQAPPDHASD
jgi:hypothetical protein